MAQTRLSAEQLRQLVERVDILQLLVSTAREELQHLAPYLIAFGAYGTLNTVAQLVWGRAWWAETLIPAFALATSLAVGVLPTLLFWAGALAVVGIVAWVVRHPLAVWVSFFGSILGALGATYRSAVRRGQVVPKFVLSQRIGMGWGFLVAGLWLVSLAGSVPGELLGALWSYGLGVGFLLIGVLYPPFLVLALIGILGGPLAALYGQEPWVVGGIFLLMSLLMLGFGVWLWRGTGDGEKG